MAGIDRWYGFCRTVCSLAYLSWFAIGIVSSVQTEIVVSVLAILFWLAGGFAMQEWIELIGTTAYAPFAVTAPFRGLSGILCWIVIMMWYRLLALQTGQSLSKEEVMPEEEEPVKEIMSKRQNNRWKSF